MIQRIVLSLVSVFSIAGFATNLSERIDVYPGAVYFSQTPVGYWDIQTVTVRNVGEKSQSVYVSHSCYGAFDVRNYCYSTLMSYQSCSIEVWFRPYSPGYASCSINISGNQGSRFVSVTGYGVKRSNE